MTITYSLIREKIKDILNAYNVDDETNDQIAADIMAGLLNTRFRSVLEEYLNELRGDVQRHHCNIDPVEVWWI